MRRCWKRLSRGASTVRWYRWETSTVSLGYFQDAKAAALLPALRSLPVVRRLTGGGAILHHHEWTYSCALPATHPLAATPSRIYELVHETMIDVLSERGVRSSALRGSAGTGDNAQFLCFGRGDPRDIVFEGHKIVGSAGAAAAGPYYSTEVCCSAPPRCAPVPRSLGPRPCRAS